MPQRAAATVTRSRRRMSWNGWRRVTGRYCRVRRRVLEWRSTGARSTGSNYTKYPRIPHGTNAHDADFSSSTPLIDVSHQSSPCQISPLNLSWTYCVLQPDTQGNCFIIKALLKFYESSRSAPSALLMIRPLKSPRTITRHYRRYKANGSNRKQLTYLTIQHCPRICKR